MLIVTLGSNAECGLPPPGDRFRGVSARHVMGENPAMKPGREAAV